MFMESYVQGPSEPMAYNLEVTHSTLMLEFASKELSIQDLLQKAALHGLLPDID